MRRSILFLAALVMLTACGRPGEAAPATRWAGRANYIPVYGYQTPTPRCPYREVGTVQGSSYRALERAARGLMADAVILEPYVATTARGTYNGRAVRFTEAGCRQ